jgi:hypothetical protein
MRGPAHFVIKNIRPIWSNAVRILKYKNQRTIDGCRATQARGWLIEVHWLIEVQTSRRPLFLINSGRTDLDSVVAGIFAESGHVGECPFQR